MRAGVAYALYMSVCFVAAGLASGGQFFDTLAAILGGAFVLLLIAGGVAVVIQGYRFIDASKTLAVEVVKRKARAGRRQAP